MHARNHAIIVGLASDSVKLLTYAKKEDPKGFFDQICSAIKASNGGKKVGMFTGKSDEYTGSLVEGFLSAVDAAGSYKNKQTKGSTLDHPVIEENIFTRLLHSVRSSLSPCTARIITIFVWLMRKPHPSTTTTHLIVTAGMK